MDGVNVNKRLDGAVSWNTLCLKVLNGTHINPQLLSHVSLVSVVAVKVTQLIYLTNRFHVAVHLFSNRSQMTSKCGKNKKVTHEAQPSVSLMFLPHLFYIIKKLKYTEKNAFLFQISPLGQTRK